jgi:hypothetical protein
MLNEQSPISSWFFFVCLFVYFIYIRLSNFSAIRRLSNIKSCMQYQSDNGTNNKLYMKQRWDQLPWRSTHPLLTVNKIICRWNSKTKTDCSILRHVLFPALYKLNIISDFQIWSIAEEHVHLMH